MSNDGIMKKISALLERGNHPTTPQAERDLCLEKANEMMSKYAIDMALLEAKMTLADRRRPVDEMNHDSIPSNEFTTDLCHMFHVLAQTNRVRTVFMAGHGGQRYNGDVHMFGLAEDIMYVKMVWQNILFDFFTNLRPKWEASKGFDENVYTLAKAAYKWREIAAEAQAAGEDLPWPDGGRLKRAFHRHQKAIGEIETSHTQSHASYRQSFAMGYSSRVVRRLRDMEAARKGDIKQAGGGAELVLFDNKTLIDQMAAEAYPKMVSRADNRKILNMVGSLAGATAGEKVKLTRDEEFEMNRKGIGS